MVADLPTSQKWLISMRHFELGGATVNYEWLDGTIFWNDWISHEISSTSTSNVDSSLGGRSYTHFYFTAYGFHIRSISISALPGLTIATVHPHT